MYSWYYASWGVTIENLSRQMVVPMLTYFEQSLLISVAVLLLMPFGACLFSQAQPDSPEKVLVLGNTADLPVDDQSFYHNLQSLIDSHHTSIVVTGDFTDGSMNFSLDSLRIYQLMSVVERAANCNMIFIPGDRDWADSGPYGWDYVRKLEKLVKKSENPKIQWAIKDGCPGPKAIPIGERVMLIAVQTQWWNHPYLKPIPGDADCKFSEQGSFLEELEDLIDENHDRKILIAGHFPVISAGPYGGHWPLVRYLLPVPVVSGLYPSFRSNVGTSHDISNPRYTPFREAIIELMQEHHQLIYMSAHERNLQILEFNDHHLIGSGAPFNADYTARNRHALFAESEVGVVELQFHHDGKTDAVIYQNQTGSLAEMAVIPLSVNDQPAAPDGHIKPKFASANERSSSGSEIPETTRVLAAGQEYQAGKVKQAWLGKHYRKSWTTPVNVPYLDLDTTFLGLSPFQKGGGRQTLSLKLKAGDGNEYVFRSVNKDPTKALDYEYRETIIGKVVQDQTTTQQPYGALVIDRLLDSLGILHASPRLFVLPEHGKLGTFEEEFSGLLGMLEERPTNPKKVAHPFAQADDILKSHEMFRMLYEDHDNRIDTEEFARARVFDLWVGDWGRHEDNWKWAGYEHPQGVTFRPIPRDRDHVFSLWDGILPWLADREWAKPSAANFGYQYQGIRSLMWQARHMDRFLANELTREDWVEAAKFIQQEIDDSDIEEAISRLPPEVIREDGHIIGDKLKNRLKHLDQAASEYYDILAKGVDVVGSNKKEYFMVRRLTDGSVRVAVFDMNASGGPDSSRMYYQRLFLPHETKEIRLFGLHKDDFFDISGESHKSILVRVIGGAGEDQLQDRSKVKGPGKMTKVYEEETGPIFDLGAEAQSVNHWNRDVYQYQRTAFNYNTYSPRLFISSSRDFGLGIRAGVDFTRQRFGKQDFSSQHALGLAVSNENINVFDYKGQFRQVWRGWDLLVEALFADHFYFTYFFGIGNDSEKDEALFEENYYRTSYNSIQLTTGVKNEFWEDNNSHFALKLRYENNAEQIADNTILKDPEYDQEVLGVDDTNIWIAIMELDLDFRDRTSLPEKGMRAYLQHQSGLVSSNDYRGYGVTMASFEGFFTAYLNRPVTLGLKLGGSKTYGEVPFYKLKYLGQSNDLRGYLRNRFTGESTIFVNAELRWEITEFMTPLFPMKFGLKAFYDSGRVYSDYDLSRNWHAGYGGGVYLVPLKDAFSINVSVAFSKEESGLLLLGIGKSF